MYSSFADLRRKVRGGAELVAGVRPDLEKLGFVTAKGEVKLMLSGAFTQGQVDAVVKLLAGLEANVRERGLVGRVGGGAD